VNRKQLLLRTVDVETLVEPDHLVRAIWELVGGLDLTRYTAEVEAVEGVAGRTPYDPRLLISLWLYAYCDQVGSAREVERRCAYHPAYQWLTGMEVVNYHPLADFRVQHQAALDELFAQHLAVFSEAGLITLEQVAHDGTKVKASASRNSFHREKTLRAHLEAAQERVRAMGDPREPECRPRTARAQERARAADCRECALRPPCYTGRQGRSIIRTENVPVVAAYVAKMQTAEARAVYRLRAPVAEFTHAWLKAKIGLRQFCVRGLQKVRGEVLWACLAHDLQQWYRLRWKPRLISTPA
jgi:transposase